MDWAAAVEALEDGLLVLGPDDRVAACNSAAARVLGMTPAALLGLSSVTLGLPELGMVPGREGAWLRVTTAPLADGARVVSLTDVTAERERDVELRRLADLDEVTGLPNRRRFLTLLQRHLDSQRAEDAGGALLLLTLDASEALTDRTLIGVAESLRERLRTDDALGFVGGGEFAMLLPRAHTEDANRVARSLLGGLVPGAYVRVSDVAGATDAEAALSAAQAVR